MMLGLLLARAGVQVTVLEKHADFFRDFRGDTVHASTVRLIDELGLGEEFRRLPQSRLTNVAFPVPGGPPVTMGNFDVAAAAVQLRRPDAAVGLPELPCRRRRRRNRPSRLRMSPTATALVRNGGRVTRVRYRTADGTRGRAQGGPRGCHGRAPFRPAPRGRAGAEGVSRCRSTPGGSGCRAIASEKGEVAGIVPAFGRGEALLALNPHRLLPDGVPRAEGHRRPDPRRRR